MISREAKEDKPKPPRYEINGLTVNMAVCLDNLGQDLRAFSADDEAFVRAAAGKLSAAFARTETAQFNADVKLNWQNEEAAAKLREDRAAAAEEVQGKVDEAVAALTKEPSEEGAEDGYEPTDEEAALAGCDVNTEECVTKYKELTLGLVKERGEQMGVTVVP